MASSYGYETQKYAKQEMLNKNTTNFTWSTCAAINVVV